MSLVLEPIANDLQKQAAKLFDTKPPILVEVQFPGMGTSPDWTLCHDYTEFESVVEHLAPGSTVRLTSVFDVKSRVHLEFRR